MTRKTFLVALAGLLLPFRHALHAQTTPPLAAPAGPRISVADFGVRPDGSDSGPGVLAAIRALPKQSPSVLYFPRGTYNFRQTSGLALRLDGFNGLTVMGDGATLMFEGLTRPIQFTASTDVAVRGITIDYARPNFSQSEAIALSADRRTLDLRVDPAFPVTGAEEVNTMATYDRATGLMATDGLDTGGNVAQVELAGPQLLRLHLKTPLPERGIGRGSTVLVRHGRGFHAILFGNCAGITIDQVAIHASPSMGIVAEQCRDIAISNVTITPTPGSGRLMSTNADAIHISGCGGSVSIRKCRLQGMGDDGVNVNVPYLRLVKRIDARTGVFARYARRPFGRSDLPTPGSHFDFYAAATLQPISGAVVSQSEPGDTETVHFAADLPAGISEGDFAIDVARSPSLLVEDCDFPGNRARGVLAHSDAVIRNCRFTGQSEQAILLAPDSFRLEGAGASHVRIENNDIDGPNRLGRSFAALSITEFVSDDGGPRSHRSKAIVNQGIAIANNRFHQPNGAAIAADGSSDLTIEGNRIDSTCPTAIVLENVRTVTIAGNTCVRPGLVEVAAADAQAVSLRGNTRLTLQPVTAISLRSCRAG